MDEFLRRKDERLSKIRSKFSDATDQEKMNVTRVFWLQFIECCEALDIYPCLFFPDSAVSIDFNPHEGVELGLSPYSDC